MRPSHLLSLSALAMAFAMPATAATLSFTADLSSAGEPVPTSSATGNALVTFDDVANSVSVNLNWSGLLGSNPFGHIHCCTAAVGTGNAGVALGFGTLDNVATGSYTGTFSPMNFASLLTGVSDGKAYVNIHTPGTYQAGEIRGFLMPVPEPSTYVLLLSGLVAVGAAVRRRKGS